MPRVLKRVLFSFIQSSQEPFKIGSFIFHIRKSGSENTKQLAVNINISFVIHYFIRKRMSSSFFLNKGCGKRYYPAFFPCFLHWWLFLWSWLIVIPINVSETCRWSRPHWFPLRGFWQLFKYKYRNLREYSKGTVLCHIDFLWMCVYRYI